MEYTLSVIFITYNHGKYVEKALRSILAQETDFPFEVVVGDDCSTDDTRAIIESIAKDYPVHEAQSAADRQVRFVPRQKNTGRPTLNVYETTYQCTGDFLAYLEGDDYWSDNKKLQKQMDFLREHPDYIAVTHACELIDENGDVITDPQVKSVGDLYDWSGDFTFDDYCHSARWPGHYATVVSRNIYKNNINNYDYTILYRAHDFVDDAIILLFLLMQGKIFRMDDKMSAWRYVRKSGGTNWNSLAMQRNLAKDDCYLSQTIMKWIETTIGLGEFSKVKCRDAFGLALRMFLTKPNKENLQFLRDMYEYGITHVVLEDKKGTLVGYSIKMILNKIFKR